MQSQIKTTGKTSIAPAIEGTSVMPRQRPKASSTTPLNLNNLPLTLSPSPTAKKSQSPITFTDSHFQTYPSTAKTNIVQQTFAGAPTQIFPASQSYSPAAFQSNQFFPSQENSEKSLDNLFQSSIYPDPFRDDQSASPSLSAKAEFDSVNSTDPQVPVTSPISPNQPFGINHGLNGQKQGLVESTSQCVVAGTSTPPCSPTLSIPKGHRRNMSDTSAFNK